MSLWLNSGAPALAIRCHLLKVGNFYGTSSEQHFYSQKIKKIKIKSRPPTSFSEKKCLGVELQAVIMALGLQPMATLRLITRPYNNCEHIDI